MTLTQTWGMETRRTSDAEFKRNAVELARQEGNTVEGVAHDPGVGRSTLQNRPRGVSLFCDASQLGRNKSRSPGAHSKGCESTTSPMRCGLGLNPSSPPLVPPGRVAPAFGTGPSSKGWCICFSGGWPGTGSPVTWAAAAG
ncbi:hypothetical protein DAETH_38020 (plasmid) [Deinococcus aetherius]|uniref:Transposase n=1 Tax=Deinococcus aetherius TaxID=200252 RepID=A0ABN6RM54_9DEIO|nr:hypothetical protein DAETH_38020 [Deinococcus aetherius]